MCPCICSRSRRGSDRSRSSWLYVDRFVVLTVFFYLAHTLSTTGKDTEDAEVQT